MARGTYAGGPGNAFAFDWHGRKIVQDWEDRVLLPALQDRARAAEADWRARWTTADHPYMTGEERDEGFFLVERNPSGTVSLVIGSGADHALYHELGWERAETGEDGKAHVVASFAGHPIIRQTADAIAPTIAPALRRAARAAGF